MKRNNPIRGYIRSITILLSLLILLGFSGCKKESSSDTNREGVNHEKSETTFSSIVAPEDFDYSSQHKVRLEITVYNPTGKAQKNAVIQIYTQKKRIDHSVTGGSIEEFPVNLVAQVRTDNNGKYKGTLLLPKRLKVLHLIAGVFGIPNSAMVSINSDKTVTHTFQ